MCSCAVLALLLAKPSVPPSAYRTQWNRWKQPETWDQNIQWRYGCLNCCFLGQIRPATSGAVTIIILNAHHHFSVTIVNAWQTAIRAPEIRHAYRSSPRARPGPCSSTCRAGHFEGNDLRATLPAGACNAPAGGAWKKRSSVSVTSRPRCRPEARPRPPPQTPLALTEP